MDKNLQNNNDKYEFKPEIIEIEETPVSPIGRTIIMIIVSAIAFFTFWLYWGKIDVVVPTRGQFFTKGETKIIQPIDGGAISAILVKEGDKISKEDVLIEIDPTISDTNLKAKTNNLHQLNLEIIRLQAMIDDKPFVFDKTNYTKTLIQTQINLYDSGMNSYKQKLKSNEIELQKLADRIKINRLELSKNRKLIKTTRKQKNRLEKVKLLISKTEYENIEDKIISYISTIESIKLNIKENKNQIQQTKKNIISTKEEFKNKSLAEFSAKQKELELLQAEIQTMTYRNKKQKIKSPIDGYVGKLLVHTIGGVVTSAQKLISIVPSKQPLLIKTTVLNKDVGFIKIGMKTSIKVDAFDFQKYGIIDGEVTHISNDSIEDERLGLVYEVYVRPSKDIITAEGKTIKLTSGMSLTAEIKVGKRRIIEFFIYPLIKYLDEGMSVR